MTKEIGPGGMAGVVVDVMEDLTDGSGSVTISAIVLKKEILKQVCSMSEILPSVTTLKQCCSQNSQTS